MELEELVSQLAMLQEHQAELTEKIEATKLAIAEQLPDGGTVGNIRVQVTYTRRLDNKKLVDTFPVIDHPELYEPKLSSSRVRAYLSPIELLDFETQSSKPTVVLR